METGMIFSWYSRVKSGKISNYSRLAIIDVRQVGMFGAGFGVPGYKLRTPAFMNVAKAMHLWSSSSYDFKNVWASSALTRVSVTHDSPWRAMSHHDIGIVDGEFMAMLGVALEPPVAKRRRVRTGVDLQMRTVLQ